MNRRGFLSSLAAIAAGATLDPERLLWRPGAKLISIPPRRPVLICPQIFAREALRILQHNLVIAERFSSEWEAEFRADTAFAEGEAWQIRRPRRTAA